MYESIHPGRSAPAGGKSQGESDSDGSHPDSGRGGSDDDTNTSSTLKIRGNNNVKFNIKGKIVSISSQMIFCRGGLRKFRRF